MSVTSTRTRKSVSPANAGSAEKAVLAVSEKNRKYVAKTPTANLVAFATFVRNERIASEGKFATKAESDAFDLGVRLAGLRASFQIDRKAGKVAPEVTFSEYAIGSSGIDVPTGSARTALLAGIGSYTRYVAYRDSRKVSA